MAAAVAASLGKEDRLVRMERGSEKVMAGSFEEGIAVGLLRRNWELQDRDCVMARERIEELAGSHLELEDTETEGADSCGFVDGHCSSRCSTSLLLISKEELWMEIRV